MRHEAGHTGDLIAYTPENDRLTSIKKVEHWFSAMKEGRMEEAVVEEAPQPPALRIQVVTTRSPTQPELLTLVGFELAPDLQVRGRSTRGADARRFPSLHFTSLRGAQC